MGNVSWKTKEGGAQTGRQAISLSMTRKRAAFSVYPSLNYGAIASMARDGKGNIFVSTNKAVFSFNATLSKINLHKLMVWEIRA